MGKWDVCQDCWCVSKAVQKRERVAYVGIIQCRGQYPEKQDKPDEHLRYGPPGYHKRTSKPGDLGPIKREEGHSQPRPHAKQLVDYDVVRGCPAYERKDRKRLEKIACSVSR